MTPLFACFPVCLTFVSISIIGVIVVMFGLSNPTPLNEAAPEEVTQPRKLPPLWVFPLTLLLLTVLMLALAWYWPE